MRPGYRTYSSAVALTKPVGMYAFPRIIFLKPEDDRTSSQRGFHVPYTPTVPHNMYYVVRGLLLFLQST